jgi:AcrR family transcriptional regulator
LVGNLEGMARDADRTRQRILAAAVEEFAALGIAGARVNHIAEVAGCNKAMLYAYFGNKDQLFDAVFTAHVNAYLEQVTFDASDLPAYAGRLFDYFEDNPDQLRLSIWYRLERPQGARLEAVVAVNQTRLEQLAQAQQEGILPMHYKPAELLALVQSTSTTWSSMNPEYGVDAPADRAHRRRTVTDAVRRLLAS